MACVALKISMKPSPETLTVTRSSNTLPPVHSRKVAMPRPRSLPGFSDCRGARVEAGPVGQRQRLVSTDSNLPLS